MKTTATTCAHCGEPIRFADGRWWHCWGWFTVCHRRLAGTIARPT